METEPLAIRFSIDDKAELEQLANLLQRTRVDTIRLLVREAFTIMRELDLASLPPEVLRGRGTVARAV